MTKRDAILTAADALFSRDGYGLTGVDALASKAGVTKRTLYKQFGSKEGLFVAWLEMRDARTRASLIRAVEAMSDDPKGQILAMFTVIASFASSHNFHGCPFSRALLEFSTAQNKNAGEAIAAKHKVLIGQWFAQCLEKAGIGDVEARAEEVSLLYEGALARVAMTHKPDAALAARRLLALRFDAQA
jgi:AcrR family transcriptional regulator